LLPPHNADKKREGGSADRWPRVVAPDLGVVEPLTDELATRDEYRRRQRHGHDPEERDQQRRSTFGHSSLHREHDAEEPIAGDQRQRQDAGNQRQNCTATTHRHHATVITLLLQRPKLLTNLPILTTNLTCP